MIAAFAVWLLRVPHVTAVIFVFICPSAPSWAGPSREGNPELGSRMYLISQTGLRLSIWPNGSVRGSLDEEYGLLEVTTLSQNEVRLWGVNSKRFLAMGEDGLLYGEADASNEATVFVSGVHGPYNTYQAKLAKKYAKKYAKKHVEKDETGEDEKGKKNKKRAAGDEKAWFVGLRRHTGVPRPGSITYPDQKAAQFLPVRPL